jgi:hypothetical protein
MQQSHCRLESQSPGFHHRARPLGFLRIRLHRGTNTRQLSGSQSLNQSTRHSPILSDDTAVRPILFWTAICIGSVLPPPTIWKIRRFSLYRFSPSDNLVCREVNFRPGASPIRAFRPRRTLASVPDLLRFLLEAGAVKPIHLD